jgi:cysteine desulfurase / selenocysteine lyase
MHEVRAHDRALAAAALSRLGAVPGVELFGPTDAESRIALFGFTLRGAHPHDVAAFLDQRGICVRAGHHCAQPLARRLGIAGTVRASASVYTTPADFDALAAALEDARQDVGR